MSRYCDNREVKIKIWGAEDLSQLNEGVLQARAIRFLYNKKDAIAAPTLEEVTAAAAALRLPVYEESYLADPLSTQGVIVETGAPQYGPHKTMSPLCNIKFVNYPFFPKSAEEMSMVIQQYDPETATKLANDLADQILAGRMEIDQAYPMVESYLTFVAQAGDFRATNALKIYHEKIDEIFYGNVLEIACSDDGAASRHDARDASEEAASSCMGDVVDFNAA